MTDVDETRIQEPAAAPPRTPRRTPALLLPSRIRGAEAPGAAADPGAAPALRPAEAPPAAA